MSKIELILWYRCNCACLFCSSHSHRGGSFSFDEAVAQLAAWREAGVASVDVGGGEPTLGRELPALAEAARHLGYTTIGVKSNGMRFCYPDYARRCLDAGVGEFAISLWGHTPAVHDRLAGRPGAFERTEMGLKHLVDFGARPTVDFLVTTWTVDTLPEALTEVAGVGVRSFRLWVFSLFGSGGRRPELMPSLRAVGEAAAAAAAAVEPLGGRVVTSHVMPCLLGSRAGLYSSIRELELTVVTKDGSFAGEDSPFEAGTQVPACAGCRHSGCCLGPRPEYLERFGDAEFRAVP